MRKLILAALAVVLCAASALAQAKQADLEKVLTLLDNVSTKVHAVQANFEWDQYQSVVGEHDIQKGVMYFKRTAPNSVDIAADITAPFPKKMVFKNGVLDLYTPSTGETVHRDVSKNRKSFESFLALGFGGSGHELTKSFDVQYGGTETVNGKPTYVLKLTPKTPDVKNMFPLITLWINQQTAMSEEQKLDQGGGDYRTATFANIVVNPPKLPEDAFRLKK